MYGHLTVICGPMYAGKTTELLNKIEAARAEGQRTLILKPSFDNRYSETEIVTHDGAAVPAKAISDWDDIAYQTAAFDEIFIDEIQFFTAPYFKGDIIEHVRDCLIIGTNVVVSGLDMDWQGNSFSTTAKLMSMADDLMKLKAVCAKCKGDAPKTFKKTGGGPQIELGASDTYEARCNEHWVAGT